MSLKIFIAIMATAIVISSCEWLFPKHQPISQSSLEGKWKLDSVYKQNDSSGIGLALLLMTISSDDSSGKEFTDIVYDFKKDTLIVFIENNPKDTATFAITNSSFKITEGEAEEVYGFERTGDSSFALTTADSSKLFYRRIL